MTLPLKAGQKHELRLSRGEQPFAAPVVCSTSGATVDGIAFLVGADRRPAQPFGDSMRHLVPDASGRLLVLRLTGEGAIVTGVADSLRRPDLLAAPLHPMALLGVVAAGEAREQVTWDLDTLRTLVLNVVTADGTPVDAAALAILVDAGKGAKRALSGLCTDRSGRIAAMIPADQPVIVAAWTNEGFALAEGITAPADRAAIVMRLEKVPTVPGWVVGTNGKPASFAEVQCHVFAGDAATACLAEAIKLIEVTTDGDGTFQMPMFPGLRYSLRGVATPAGEHYLTKQWTVGKDTPEELILDLGKQR